MIKITKPGVYASIQDLGREQKEKDGLSESGALNYRAMMLANKMVGNPLEYPTIEMTIIGVEFEVLKDVVVAIFGTEKIELNNKVTSTHTWIHLKEGDYVIVGRLLDTRGYIAVKGRIESKCLFGSQSVHSQVNLIPPLAAGDVIKTDYSVVKKELRKLPKRQIVQLPKVKRLKGKPIIRVMLGEDAYRIKNLHDFFNTPYKIHRDSNRMAIRLSGRPLEASNYDILSDTTRLGLLQVAKNGEPMILMNDRQTTGGYLRLGTIARVDIPILVDLRIQSEVYFEEITIEEARQLYIKEMERIKGEYYLP